MFSIIPIIGRLTLRQKLISLRTSSKATSYGGERLLGYLLKWYPTTADMYIHKDNKTMLLGSMGGAGGVVMTYILEVWSL